MADKRQQEQETVTQKVQEEIIGSIRIKRPSISPGKEFLYDLSYADKEKFSTLTPEQQKEFIEFYSFENISKRFEKLRQAAQKAFDALKSYYSKETADMFREVQELLKDKKKLTKEEKSDLAYIESYLSAYEKYVGGTQEEALRSLHYDTMPTGRGIYLAYQAFQSLATHREFEDSDHAEWVKNGNLWTAKSESYGVTNVAFDDINMINGNSKGFEKMFIFTLKKCNEQNYRPEITFPLQELIDRGIYSTMQSARKGVRDNMAKIMSLTFFGKFNKGNKVIEEAGGKLIYHYKIRDNYVTLSFNQNLNIDFFAQSFMVIPDFLFTLKTKNATSILYCIFYLARQNAQAIAEKGCFRIGLDTIRRFLKLPNTGDTQNHAILIKKPIEDAIEEIETTNNNINFTMTLYHYERDKGKNIEDCKNVREWLQCYLEIGLHGEFAETFSSLAKDASKKINEAKKRREKALQKVLEKQLENAVTE